MFDFFPFIIAIVALIVAIKAMNEMAQLRTRLDRMEATATVARSVPPPLPLMQDQSIAPGIVAEPPPIAPEAEWISPAARQPTEAAMATTADMVADTADGPPAAPPPLPEPDRGFEETIGTRWVVWIGGLTLALGGIFMVRYSIEAGLISDEVRILLGGLFALALLAAGEWSRRKESISAIAALPIANIPAILTAAGTAVAFGTVYAAYAAYGFLVPATAFILLGLVALGTLAAALLMGRRWPGSVSPPPS